MAVRKDEKRGTWFVALHYTNRDGKTINSTKRGFKTKSEAITWEREFLANEARSTSMTFEQFVPNGQGFALHGALARCCALCQARNWLAL